jgi:hypothetical protein
MLLDEEPEQASRLLAEDELVRLVRLYVFLVHLLIPLC